MSIVPKRARTIDQTGGSKKLPAFWGLPLKFTFQEKKHWADVLSLNVDPIDLFEWAGNNRNVMKISKGVYTLGPGAGGEEACIILLTTSKFDVENNDGVSPLQLETDLDTIFRGSTLSTQNTPGLNTDMEILPDGAEIVVVTPTLYAYAWRGGKSFSPDQSTETGYNENIVYCSIKLAYRMVTLGADEKLDKYISSTQNASFLEFIPAAE